MWQRRSLKNIKTTHKLKGKHRRSNLVDDIDQVCKKMKKFWNFHVELTIYENLLFKGDMVIIPRAKNGSHRTSKNPACIKKSTTVNVLV
jgi:hypothetical protein